MPRNQLFPIGLKGHSLASFPKSCIQNGTKLTKSPEIAGKCRGLCARRRNLSDLLYHMTKCSAIGYESEITVSYEYNL